jgi:hypothetical protein
MEAAMKNKIVTVPAKAEKDCNCSCEVCKCKEPGRTAMKKG